jgi:hypothetical protein
VIYGRATVNGFLRLALALRFTEARDYVATARTELAMEPGILLHAYRCRRPTRPRRKAAGRRADGEHRDAQLGPASDCGYAVTEQPTTVSLTAGALGKRPVRLEYFTADTDDGWGESGRHRHQGHLRARGAHSQRVPIDGLFGGLAIRPATQLAPVSVGTVLVGEPSVSL